MRKNIFTLLLFLQILTIYGQNKEKSIDTLSTDVEKSQLLLISKLNTFIYTHSGAIISGNTIDVNTTDKKPYISIDSLKLNLSDIKFLKYGENFWANTNKVNKTNSFALRNFNGNLNIYTKVEESKQRQYITMFTAGNRLRTDYEEFTIEQNYDFYNKGLGELKEVSYENLIGDLSDNENSMLLLNKSQKFKNLKVGSLLFGVASIIYGAVTKSDNNIVKPASFVLGGVFGWTSVKMRRKQETYLLEAIKTYE